jgi:hypothetical protein
MKMPGFLLRWLLPAVSILILLPAASGQSPKRPAWTILIYGHADHSLSSQMAVDLRKMESTGSGPGFNIVVQADFDASVDEDNEDEGLPRALNRGTSRFLIAKSTNPELVGSRPVERLPELNHDDPNVLSEFIRWALKKYPADRYGLVFWDHGGQWEGYGGDEQDGTVEEPKGMSTAAIRSAVLEAMKSAGIKKWDFVAFDTCLMGGVEVLGDFADLTDIFIACPEIDYGDGWNYGPVLRWLKERPDAAMREFGIMEASLWKELHFTRDNEADRALAAHCVYDLTVYPAVQSAFSGFAAAISAAYAPSNLAIPRQRRLSIEYSLADVESLGEPTDYIDLGMFAGRFAADPKSPEPLRKSSRALVEAIEKLVIAKTLGSEKEGASGLSVWYPVDDEGEAGEKFSAYRKLSVSNQTPWARLLQRVYEIRQKQKKPPELKDPAKPELTVKMGQPLKISVEVVRGPGAFFIHGALVDNSLGRRDDFVYLGEVISREIEGIGKYPVEWDMRILTLPGEGRSHVYLGAFPKDTGNDLWVSYARYQAGPKARKRKVILITQIKAGAARVLNMLDGSDDDAAPARIKARPGGKITPLYRLEIRKGDDPDEWKSGFFESKSTVAIPAGGLRDLRVAADPLPAGSYSLEIQVEDVYGYMSDAIEYDLTVK